MSTPRVHNEVPEPCQRSQALEQCPHLGIATCPAELARRAGEIQIGIGVGLGAARLQAHGLEEALADDMRRAAVGVAHTKIDIGLTKIDRIELSVNVSYVQDTRIALPGTSVKPG
jgi:hypothetical protein